MSLLYFYLNNSTHLNTFIKQLIVGNTERYKFSANYSLLGLVLSYHEQRVWVHDVVKYYHKNKKKCARTFQRVPSWKRDLRFSVSIFLLSNTMKNWQFGSTVLNAYRNITKNNRRRRTKQNKCVITSKFGIMPTSFQPSQSQENGTERVSILTPAPQE